MFNTKNVKVKQITLIMIINRYSDDLIKIQNATMTSKNWLHMKQERIDKCVHKSNIT